VNWLDLSEKTFDFASTARDRFANGDSEVKREILFAIGSNLTLKDKQLFIEAKKPFLLLEKSLPGCEDEYDSIKPKNNGSSKRQNEASASPRLRLLGEVDDVRTYGYKASRAVALIYAHFRKEFGLPVKR
jgi:hypothetical protein